MPGSTHAAAFLQNHKLVAFVALDQVDRRAHAADARPDDNNRNICEIFILRMHVEVGLVSSYLFSWWLSSGKVK